ncbi:iron complex transport system ATP-binding protein [Marinobacter sp. MBR-99]
MMVLEIQNLSVSLAGTEIVSDINLTVSAGEVLMLLGPNGAGKSTLMKALAGELPYRGRIRLAGRELGGWCPGELARHRAIMPQSVEVNFPLTVEEVVALGRPAATRRCVDSVAETLMEALEIKHLRHRLVPGLSGGEQQRLQLARVLGQIWDTRQDRLLLLDECTSALDPAHQQMVLELVGAMAREHGVAVLAIVHDLNLAAQFADRMVVMKSGRCFHEGGSSEVLTPSLLKAVYGYRARVIQLPEGYPLVIPLASGSAQTAPLNPVCRQAS